MSLLQFNKQALGNLEYSLQREVLSTNRAGGYMNTTIVCCNTRKYHGLMVCPVEGLGDDDFVLLSSLDETVIQHDQEFNLAIHRFPGSYEPRGHKYIVDFAYTPTPTITYRVGGVLLRKELLWVHTSEQLLIRYTLLEAKSDTRLRLRPFLAFRSRHALSHENREADGRSVRIPGGVRNRLYPQYPWLHMQLSKESRFVIAPDWYHRFEYLEEVRRGYPAHEDLMTTGYFEFDIAKGESVVFSGSTAEANPDTLAERFDREVSRRSVKTEFLPALFHSARQFLVHRKGEDSMKAGYPWYNARSRETFISLAGITLTQGLTEQCADILDRHVGRLNRGIFGTHFAADTQLWFFHTLQQLERNLGGEAIWQRYGAAMKEILEAYRAGLGDGDYIHMAENGLIWAELDSFPLTWMNAVNGGAPVTRRSGFAVEVNALWYNAVCYALHLAQENGDRAFADRWGEFPSRIADNFLATFWLEGDDYLADHVRGGWQSREVRPNQLIACSLAYTPLGLERRQRILQVVSSRLLTPRGIRTLSPDHPCYQGHCRGDQWCRNEAAHQGTAYPWLLEHYVRAGYSVHGPGFAPQAEEILAGFEEDMLNYIIGSVPEAYDGDAPHEACGAMSYAPSVAALLEISRLVHG